MKTGYARCAIVGLLLALALLLACGGAQQPPGNDLDVRLDRESRADGEQLPAQDDRAALEALYHATDAPNWIASHNWLSDAPLGQWLGVSTDASGRVKHLGFDDNRLSGEVPPELGDLANLEVLRLSYNQLSGEIPPQLGNLPNLRWLGLVGNRLSGEIPPELGNLTNLDVLELYDNQLSGEIPPELGNLSNLQWLELDNNQLSGEIPPELGNLTKLEWLELDNNQLSGGIPPEFGNLTKLDTLLLHENRLSGCVPIGLPYRDSGMPSC